MTWYIEIKQRGRDAFSHYQQYDSLGHARQHYRAMQGAYPQHRFRLVTTDTPPITVLPRELSMPWNCAICAAEHPVSVEPLEIVDDETHAILTVCTTCYNANEAQCACCSQALRNPQQPNGANSFICYDCVDHHFECEECEVFRNTDLRHTLPGGTTACRECYNQRYVSCGSCGEAVSRDTVDEGLCARCARGRVIRSHSYKPRPNLHGHGPLYYGVELEVECGTRAEPADVAHEVVDEIGGGFVYAKHDGSLDHGFEVVSHPFSDDWYNSTGKSMWSRILKALKTNGCRSYETQTCGMHVHVTRSAMTPHQLLRLQRLSHNNPDLILTLSRRKRANLQQWANPRDSDIREQLGLAVGRNDHKRNRYAAINVTEKTVEIRIFRGTCDEDGFFGNLEAVRSLVEFSKQEIGLFPRSKDYLAFLKTNEAQYPNLVGTVLRGTALV